MTSSVAAMRERLIEAWDAIPDHPPADHVDALCERAHGLVRLIGWCDLNTSATMQDYRAELARMKEQGR